MIDDIDVSKLEKSKELLAKCENRIKAQPENLTEHPDLNVVAHI